MSSRSPVSRNRLLMGASATALFLAGSPAYADGANNPFARVANPAAAIAQAAQAQITQGDNGSAAAQRALAAFAQASAIRRSMDAAQMTARVAAAAAQASVPNGLGAGGLQPAAGATPGTPLWLNANAPTQSATSDGRTEVTVQQTASQAILNWQTFNVGQKTDVNFDQQNNSSWVVLNRVNDPSANPTQILGTVKAPGTVMIMNRNGVIFGGNSQVNVGNIVAAAGSISDTQFLNNGIYSPAVNSTYTPSITDALGQVKVEAGAQLSTNAPASVLQGGGYVMLLGGSVENDGVITTPMGQTLMAAGDAFNLRQGYGTASNAASTTRGTEVAPVIAVTSQNGTVTNDGDIYAQQGDITLAGRTVTQAGVALSTTSVNQRGTIHLLNSAADGLGSVTLTGNSLTAILPELDSTDTALNSQRDALIAASGNTAASGQFDNLSQIADRRDQSRVEIETGGNVDFQGGSYTLAQGGQIAVSAGKQVLTENGAWLDVSGVRDVALNVADNEIMVNVQGNELRDAPANRDDPNKPLYNEDVWVDARNLIYVPAGTGGYATDRYYTSGGLLEVSGYLSNVDHSIGEWDAVAGTITVSANKLVAQTGSMFNISGGSLDYAGGTIMQTLLQGADGKIYTADTAPANIDMVSVGKSFEVAHPRWGAAYTETFESPFTQTTVATYEPGYIVGRDAGQLILSAPTTVFDGDIDAEVVDGIEQTDARPQGVSDGYKLSQSSVAQAGQLVIGIYIPGANSAVSAPIASAITFSNAARPDDPTSTNWFNASQIDNYGLGGLTVYTGQTIEVHDPLTLADGARVNLAGPSTDIAAALTARGGSVTIGAVPGIANANSSVVTLEPGGVIDTRGIFTNILLNPTNLSGLAFIDGGDVTLGGTVALEGGSLIDASAGGAVLPNGKVVIGNGGNISLAAPETGGANFVGGSLTLDGTIRSNGATGGQLNIETDSVYISDSAIFTGATLAANTPAPLAMRLASNLPLSTGETLPFDATLGSTLMLPIGTELPFSLSYKTAIVPPGQQVLVFAQPAVSAANPLVTAADWTIPSGWGSLVTSAGTKTVGAFLPAGTVITKFSSFINVGTTVPAAVFPNGLPMPSYTRTIAAGVVLNFVASLPAGTVWAANAPMPAGATLAAGTLIPTGQTFLEAATISPVLNLTPQFFQQGFSSYTINGSTVLDVAPGTLVSVTEPIYQANATTNTAVTGSDPASAFSLVLNPVYLADPVHATLTKRPGANLTLLSGNYPFQGGDVPLGGSLSIGTGSSISVDPGNAVSIASGGQVTVDGTISAPGGSITIVKNGAIVTQPGGFVTVPTYQLVWIGADAVLDVSAKGYTASDLQGRPFGVVPNGGTITLGNTNDGLVIIRPGALIEASGASAAIDLDAGNAAGSRQPDAASDLVQVASNGGTIALASPYGIYNDGTLIANAGGPGASGGTLSITLESDVAAAYAAQLNPNVAVPRILTVTEDYTPSGLAADLLPNQTDPALTFGKASISSEQIEQGGFDNVSLDGRNGVVFAGDVVLNAGQSISLLKGGLFDSVAGGNVSLNAPYVLLSGQTNASLGYPVGTPAQPAGGTFSVNADLIDIRDEVTSHFADTALNSTGDIRFLASTNTGPQGTQIAPITYLETFGNLELIGAQIYPASDANVQVWAGLTAIDTSGSVPQPTFDTSSTITIGSPGGPAPTMPYSLFGEILLDAPQIEQGGVLRAPMGSITLGGVQADAVQTGTSLVEFLPGSITSVSAAGLTISYGGTPDGVTYTVNGGTPDSVNVITGQITTANPIQPVVVQGINVVSTNVQGDPGSLLDLSGGGTLTGAAFVSGRGGSVDTLMTPLISSNPANRFSAPGNTVYAIVPGAQVAPPAGGYSAAWTGDAPSIGQQITIPGGVPGLAAGTYTLMPANYALLPGAYRVELGGTAKTPVASVSQLPGGSYALNGYQGVANTAYRDSLPTSLIVTPGAAIRTYSQYNEQSYDAYEKAQASQFGNLRPALEGDGKYLVLTLEMLAPGATSDAPALTFNGVANFTPEDGSFGGSLSLMLQGPYMGPSATMVVTPDNANVLRTSTVTPIAASTVDAFNAPNLYVGALPQFQTGSTPQSSLPNIYFMLPSANQTDGGIEIQGGASLTASQIALYAGGSGGVTLDTGSVVSTLGRADLSPDVSATKPWDGAFLLVSNTPATLAARTLAGGEITVQDGAAIYAENIIGFGADSIKMFGVPLIGARNLDLSVGVINIGNSDALAADAASLSAGVNIDQNFMDRLLKGDPSIGAPAVETLTLGASQSINFVGSFDINTIDPVTGKSSLQQFVLHTPAIYGYGAGATDQSVKITTDAFVWAGAVKASGFASAPVYNSALPGTYAGTPDGIFNVYANTITFGQPDGTTPLGGVTPDRLMLGFSTVNFNAAQQITANNKGSLSVYESGPDTSAGFNPAAYAGVGGDLNLNTPLLTGAAGSTMAYIVGGALTIAPPAGAPTGKSAALGAEIDLKANSIDDRSAILLPSGLVSMTAVNDITLEAGSVIDVAGQPVPMFDVTEYSWGGSVTLESTAGNIIQQDGSSIDVSAQHNNAGGVTAIAMNQLVDGSPGTAGKGSIILGGTLAGGGGSSDGYQDGTIDIRAQQIGSDPANLSADFADLNAKLNEAGFFGGRSFDFKQGSLAIGDSVKAHQIAISVDDGSLTVNGTLDASGTAPGTIRLASRDDLTLNGALDVHGTVLNVDSYGQPVEATNRGHVELTTMAGTLVLADVAAIDLSSPDDVARGEVVLNAPRTGATAGASATGSGAPANATATDIAISAPGQVNIAGAGSIALNGVADYANAPADPDDNNGQIVNQAWLGLIDQDSQAFVNGLYGGNVAGGTLASGVQARLAGLLAYGGAVHLRPGVEIDSATPNGDLTLSGDIDLAGYRYGPNAGRNPASASYGAGEPMALVVRAGGNLTINGSVSDGFGVSLAGTPATAPMLAPGMMSASIRFVAGADLSAADTRTEQSGSTLASYYRPGSSSYTGFVTDITTDPIFNYYPADEFGNPAAFLENDNAPLYLTTSWTLPNDPFWQWIGSFTPDGQTYFPGDTIPAGTLLPEGFGIFEPGTNLPGLATGHVVVPTVIGSGHIVLNDPHTVSSSSQPLPSVIRTGTGDLDVLAAGNFSEQSLYGIYTAGTNTSLGANNAAYSALGYYPDHGGDLLVSAYGNLTGWITQGSDFFTPSSMASNWLLTQGDPSHPTAWAINFGSYSGNTFNGFTGFGALGGGNVTIEAGGDAGLLAPQGTDANNNQYNTGLAVAVGATGRVTSVATDATGAVTGGTLTETGGGDITLRIGGALNPGAGAADPGYYGDEWNGVFTDTRGDINVDAGSIGTIPLTYAVPEVNDPRAVQANEAELLQGLPKGGIVLDPGDGSATLQTRGDLVLGFVTDPGLSSSLGTGFSFWQPSTAINLISAGGNVVPLDTANVGSASTSITYLPPIFSVLADAGSIYYGGINFASNPGTTVYELMPSKDGELNLLAGQSIYGDALGIQFAANWALSTAPYGPNDLPNPFKPIYGNGSVTNVATGTGGGLFNFETDVVSDMHDGDPDPMRFYAVNGDVVNLQIGYMLPSRNFSLPAAPIVGKTTDVRAGRDIVSFGNYQRNGGGRISPSIIMNSNPDDISLVSAGRDVIYTNVEIAGPGDLVVSAGRNLYQGNQGTIVSLGPLVDTTAANRNSGANITLLAGVGADGPDYSDFAKLYFDNANLANVDIPDTDPRNAGKVPQTYEDAMYAWLQDRFGYRGAESDALSYFLALPSEQQGLFVRQVYYEELDAGGKEFNDPSSKRFKSYLRGRDAISALFPGNAYSGDITMFGPSGVQTQFGGNIETLTPGGQTIIGVEGLNPPGTAGLITQGTGNVDIYSLDSVLLGQSRVMTTFGGNILVWSAEGDINAGRGTKTDVVFTPPRRVYDKYGNVTLSTTVPSTGAGIATLDPIPEVPRGDINLVAPLGTVDAGEAGIRVSGNVNIAALHVINAANIQVKGASTGIPTEVAVNAGALTSASNAAAAVSNLAAQMVPKPAPMNIPAIVTVQFIGFGE
jgi:filamentous hemagglutinin family protein